MIHTFFLKLIFSLSTIALCLPVFADRFVVIKFEMPEREKYMTYVFDSKGNRCWQVLDHLYARYSRSCKDCQTIQNACVDVLPKSYDGVFKKSPITNPYIILEGALTKAVIYEGFGANTFNSMCHMQKQQSQKSSCIFPDKKTDKK